MFSIVGLGVVMLIVGVVLLVADVQERAGQLLLVLGVIVTLVGAVIEYGPRLRGPRG